MKKLAALTAISATALVALYWFLQPPGPAAEPPSIAPEELRSPFQTPAGFSASEGDWSTVIGTVERTLSDDRDGSAHQRFILRLDDGRTLLISHNIDLAPRLEGLQKGERLTVRGVYQWNDRGGVIHWTHHDPEGKQPGGYIERQGRRYR